MKQHGRLGKWQFTSVDKELLKIPQGGGGVPAYLGFIGMWPFRGYGFNKSKQFSLGIQIREFRP